MKNHDKFRRWERVARAKVDYRSCSVASTSNDRSTLLITAARQSRASRLPQPRRQQTMAEMKARQLTRIRKLKQVLVDAGVVAVEEQGEALGLKRSTTWTVLRANYKSSGLSASIINRILEAPKLPPPVRDKILEYFEEKLPDSTVTAKCDEASL